VERAPAGRTEGAALVDRDLVEAARQGDREAYADLIRVRGDRLYAIAQRILRDVHLTEDAVQDALVIAWRDLPGLRDPDRFDAWLTRIIVRAAVHEATRHRRRVVVDIQALPVDIPTAADDYVSVGDRDQLERGFRRLPPEQRALLVLRHYAGLEPAEIADVLGIPAGTARSRLHHAHRAMRAALDADARSSVMGGLSA
jgi:RNA polymerase sigma-70 factor (ECF subfamily)